MILRPGGVTVEQLREFLPNIAVYQKDSNKDMEAKPPTPGLKCAFYSLVCLPLPMLIVRRYRHYSPEAKVILLEGNPARIPECGARRVQELLALGKKVGVIATHKSSIYPHDNPKCALYFFLFFLCVALFTMAGIVQRIGDERTPNLVARGLFHALRSVWALTPVRYAYIGY